MCVDEVAIDVAGFFEGAVDGGTGGVGGLFTCDPEKPIGITGLAPGQYELRVWRSGATRPKEGTRLSIQSGENEAKVVL